MLSAGIARRSAGSGAPVIALSEQRTGARSPAFEREDAADAPLQAAGPGEYLLSGARADPQLGEGILGADRRCFTAAAVSHRLDGADSDHLRIPSPSCGSARTPD